VSLDPRDAETRYLREPSDQSTPETIYDRLWAVTLLHQVLDRLGAEWEARGKHQEFDQLKACLMGDLPADGYREVAKRLSTTEGAAKMAVQRLKRRFGHELRAAIADTVTDDTVDDELRYLLAALRP
jgi:RNA polymerase sigma-70 factor (ECF subfamily)